MIHNPILKGFCPDPSILRVGKDYYLATSTFQWWPGVRLWHSRDLTHWHQIESPLTHHISFLGEQAHCGIWAPDLSFHDGLFFLVYTDTKERGWPTYTTHNYLVTAPSIHGPWSDPIYLNSSGFDPSLFHAPDGKKYLINMINGFKGIVLQEYDPRMKRLVGEPSIISKGSGLPYTEGPHLYFHNGKYYLMLAEGGTSYGHCVTIQRSEHLLGPYETDPESPLITSRDDPFSPFQRSGHGSLVETPKNQWFIAYLCSRPILGTHLSPLGRETALANVKWSEDDWLRLVSGNKKHPSAFLPSPLGIPEYHPTKEPEHDDFTSMTKLPVWYASPRTKADYTFHGALRLFGREVLTSRFTVSLVGRRRTSLYTRDTTQCIFTPPSPDVMAGLAYYYDEDNFLAVGKTKTSDDTALQLLVMRQGKGTKETLLTGNTPTITLAVEIRGVIAQFFLIDGTEETPIFAPQDAAMATDETTGGFTGSMITIFCVDVSGNRSFADFSYLEISPSRRKDTSPSKE